MRRRRFSLEEFIRNYNQVFRELYRYRGRLSVRLAKLNTRLSKLQSYMELYKERGDLETSYLYAREYKVVYIVREMVWSMILKIDSILSRIDTVKTFISGFEGMDQTVEVLYDVAKYSGLQINILEKLSRELGDEYINILNEEIISERLMNPIILPHPDAKSLLIDIERSVVKEISKKFPEVPREFDVDIGEDVSKVVNKLYEAIATDGGSIQTALVRPRRSYIGGLKIKIDIDNIKKKGIKKLDKQERILLNYLLRISHDSSCKINIYDLARLFRTTPLKILDSLYELSGEGYISFE